MRLHRAWATPLVIAKKEERLRTELKPGGMRTTATGAAEEVRHQISVREYWVPTDQSWHQITEEQYKVAGPNVTLEVCC